MPAAPDLLAASDRCVVAVQGRRGPVLSPMACWWDGAGLWMTTPASSAKVAALRREPSCVAWVPPLAPGQPGAVVRGRTRLFSLDDPVGLALHSPSISGALLALAARNAPQILGYVQEAHRVPVRFWPRNRVVVRLAAERVRGVVPPEPLAGMAPPLPTVVPSDVRRILGGERRLTVGFSEAGRFGIVPATWGAGFSLSFTEGHEPPVGARLAAVVNSDTGSRPTQVVGLVVHGRHDPAGQLAVERVTWWHGFELHSAAVPAASASRGVELPD